MAAVDAAIDWIPVLHFEFPQQYPEFPQGRPKFPLSFPSAFPQRSGWASP